MFIIQLRTFKIYFLVFKKSTPEYDNQFINKFHQICYIELPEFRGHGTSIMCSTYENDREILYSFELLKDSQLKSEVKVLESFKTLENIYPMKQNNIPEELIFQQHRCGEHKYRKIKHFKAP